MIPKKILEKFLETSRQTGIFVIEAETNLHKSEQTKKKKRTHPLPSQNPNNPRIHEILRALINTNFLAASSIDEETGLISEPPTCGYNDTQPATYYL